MNHNKLFIMFYWIPMITTGAIFQIFHFYATHQTRTKNCGKFIFHVELDREKKNYVSHFQQQMLCTFGRGYGCEIFRLKLIYIN